MASETWSAILSGWPSVTDSEVNKWRFFDKRVLLSKRFGRYVWRGMLKRPHEMQCFAVLKRLPENERRRNLFGAEVWVLAVSGAPSGAEGRGHGFGGKLQRIIVVVAGLFSLLRLSLLVEPVGYGN
jgi:hypothetical protein